jgi:hypothetical protein
MQAAVIANMKTNPANGAFCPFGFCSYKEESPSAVTFLHILPYHTQHQPNNYNHRQKSTQQLQPPPKVNIHHHDALAELVAASVGIVFRGRPVFHGFSTLQTTTTMHLLNSSLRQ